MAADAAAASPGATRNQTLIGAGVLALGAVLAAGAWFIPAEAGYAGVGPNFLPWVVAIALGLCGALLIVHAHVGGWRQMEDIPGAEHADWPALAWVVAGVSANAALITTLGFVLSCTLCFMLAVRGLRLAEGKPHVGTRGLMRDAVTGLLIAAPAYWLFTKVLAINLPGLTASGWL
ncbi:MAG: tripartite tricarboxylate transporter TctB [Leptothrix sp. (in: Bacteria)]|nr:tripartite tricarboxylate transporter TctB [Leptothrix sp. (in: b-proteobacteria)]